MLRPAGRDAQIRADTRRPRRHNWDLRLSRRTLPCPTKRRTLAAMSTVSIRDLTRNASGVVDEVARTGRPALVTKRGQLVAAVVPIDADGVEDYVMANSPDIIASLAEADADLAADRVVSHEDVFAHLSDSDDAA